MSGSRESRLSEERALEILQQLDHCRFSELKQRDRPDLADETRSIGVEVTQAVEQEDCYAEAIFSDIVDRQDGEATEKQITALRKCGARYYEGILVESARWSSPGLLIECVRRKLRKLNGGGYSIYSTNLLFVFVETSLTNSMRAQALEQICSLSKGHAHSFEAIFVYDRFRAHEIAELSVRMNRVVLHQLG